MRRRTKVLVGVGVGVVVLGGAAVVVGPGLYADWSNRAAAEEPTLDAPSGDAGALDPASLAGDWTVADGSYAGYRVHEVLQGEDVTVTGRTDEVTGSFTVADGALTAATVEVDMASVATDEPPRDAYFRGSALDVGTFPTATFALTEPADLPTGTADVELTGDLTIHGVTRPVTVEAQVGTTADGVQVVGSVPITFSDFDVQAPSLGFVTVDDAGSVEFGLDLVRSAGS
ncbi:YceI family protein [Cellulosimicrobium cellulans]|uniref:YceI family protein n=1 Tax=Cellulosimicrobium cellulans TaxID=1710 RepID=UPI002096B402|nr:YceI family protein [Cellulosimicrobium cellulans]MCO7273537.1 YceI family protein [Cellulosimicrobium cellulans]